jgi:signal transduction histidine kinase
LSLEPEPCTHATSEPRRRSGAPQKATRQRARHEPPAASYALPLRIAARTFVNVILTEAPISGVRDQLSATERLVEVAQELSTARDLGAIQGVVRLAARELTGADGATFVLRDGEHCSYADESAISPLWKGHRFPMSACISGWAMLHREAAVIEDIYADRRIPEDVYRPTFVKSLAMVPIRTAAPVGAIGIYWAERHLATDGEVKLLRALADLISVAMENVQLYQELQKRMREAHEAIQARDEFMSVAAHELRTPLTAMLLQLQRLQGLADRSAGKPSSSVSECASRSVAAARRFAALVDGLLDASRLTYGRIQLHVEDFDLVETAREVLERFAAAATRARCDLTLEAPSAVPGRWDRLRIEQVLTNLLSNALKYGPGKPIRVVVERLETGAHVEVRDHGPGIAPEVAGKIFERFGRAGPVSHYAGLGLGLYLARGVIEAHSGTIRFESEPNCGCTFLFDLPLCPSDAAKAALCEDE